MLNSAYHRKHVNADFERENNSLRYYSLAIYILFQQWLSFNGIFGKRVTPGGLCLRRCIPISVALAPGASPCPTRVAVHATRIIANGEAYCEHAGVWISRFVTQISTGPRANTRRVLAPGIFITVCSRCTENTSYVMWESRASQGSGMIDDRESYSHCPRRHIDKCEREYTFYCAKYRDTAREMVKIATARKVLA